MVETFLHGVEVVESDAGSRPITTTATSIIGVVGTAPDADAATFPFNTPVLVAGSRNKAAALGTAGTLPDALAGIFAQIGAAVIVVRVDAGKSDTDAQASVIGGVDATTGQYTGVSALLAAQSVVGYTPRILIAPGFTHQRAEDGSNAGKFLSNPVVAALDAIAPRLRAVVVADGPNTTDAAALDYASQWGDGRVYVVDPWVMVTDSTGSVVAKPPSSYVAGLIAKVDAAYGFWVSPSNQVIAGIVGTARPVDFALGDANAAANLLNGGNVATIISCDGYRLWGNRAPSSDPKYQFLSVRRTADAINDSLLKAHLWAVDRNITKTYTEEVVEGVNSYLRGLKAQGAILGGTCYADPDLNTPENIANGKVFFDFDFTPPFPAEHITFTSTLTNDYISEIFSNAD